MYDLLVAGAGIAGLHVATTYLRKHPTHRVLIIEKNQRVGGRISTHHPTIKDISYQRVRPHKSGVVEDYTVALVRHPQGGVVERDRIALEAGAGRIPVSHKRVIGLIKAYGLTFQPWHAPKSLVDPFPDLVRAYLPPLLRLPPAVLASNTLDTLLHSVYGKEVAESFIVQFPYWAEMRTLRADVALDAFLEGPLGQGAERRESAERKGTEGAERREGPQGPESHGWGGCAEGLSALTDRMGEDIIQRGGTIRLRTSLVEVRPHVRGVEVRIHEKGQKEEEWLACKKLVVALDAESLRHVKGLGSRLPVLRHLKAEPLLRVYAIFPTEKQKPWFAGMAKVVVSTPIRFFIPMDEAKGVAMISYTEGRDAEHWMRIKDKGDRERALMRELRRTFPEKEIPDPLAIFFYGWEQGCTYWLPSKSTASASLYSVEEASAHSVQPFPRVPLYLCGESFAVQQSWMESALIQAERVLRAL